MQRVSGGIGYDDAGREARIHVHEQRTGGGEAGPAVANPWRDKPGGSAVHRNLADTPQRLVELWLERQAAPIRIARHGWVHTKEERPAVGRPTDVADAGSCGWHDRALSPAGHWRNDHRLSDTRGVIGGEGDPFAVRRDGRRVSRPRAGAMR